MPHLDLRIERQFRRTKLHYDCIVLMNFALEYTLRITNFGAHIAASAVLTSYQ